MTIKWLRVLLGAVIIEVLAILILVLVVALWGPGEPDADLLFAERIGAWLGPLAGIVLCFAGSWILTKKLEDSQVANGLALGVAVAVIDVALLIAGGSGFRLVFVVSNVGKIVAGYIGAVVASRQSDAV